MRFILFLILAVMVLPTQAQMTVSGVKLPAQIKKDEKALSLNGAGTRKKYFMSVYVAGLYMETKSKNAKQIIEADQAMGVRIQVVSSLVTSDNMSEPIREGFKKSLDGKTAPLQDKIDQFIKTFSAEDIDDGDVFDLWYIPGVGVKSYKNGKYKSTISGLDFKKALFGIWLGADPVSDDLKEDLLGG